MCNPEYIIRTAPEVLAGSLHHKQNVFQTFLDGGKVKKRVFTRFFYCNYGFPHVFLTLPPL